MGTSSSLTDIGLIFLVNVLLISNYFFVRRLRNSVDSTTEESSGKVQLEHLQKWYDEKIVKTDRQINPTEITDIESKTSLKSFRNGIFAFVFGRHLMEPSLAVQFPNWRPIPHNLGFISTSLALLLTVFLLSNDIIENRVSVAVNRKQSTGLCATDDFDEKINAFRNHIIKNVTNYHVGDDQRNATLSFVDALLFDTTLYGTPGFECPREDIGSKEGYESQDKHLENGSFFPGYCEAALDLALQTAMKQKCIEKKRVCFNWSLSMICKVIDVPVVCPPHTYDAEVEELQNYRVEQRKRRDEDDVVMESDASNLEFPEEKSSETLKTILKQIDIAGTLYSIYICVALFFPSPLRIFRPSFIVQAKQFLFGVDKYTFIATVLIIWWVVQYIEFVLVSPELNIYIRNLMKDPCFLDSDFIRQRSDIVNRICTDLVSMENEWGLAKIQIDEVKAEVDSFNSSCGCHFPNKSLYAAFGEMPSGDAETIGFDNEWIVTTDDELSVPIWSPSLNSTFLGNETICVDRDYARNEILVAEETDISFWEAWIMSGLLANLLIKIAVTNFGVSLLKLADPFCTCGGTYECPPLVTTSDGDGNYYQEIASIIVDDDVKKDKASALHIIATRNTLIWGFITNSCLLSLLVVAASNLDVFLRIDYILFASLMIISLLVPFGCFSLANFVNRIAVYQIKEDHSSDSITIIDDSDVDKVPANIENHSSDSVIITSGSDADKVLPESIEVVEGEDSSNDLLATNPDVFDK